MKCIVCDVIHCLCVVFSGKYALLGKIELRSLREYVGYIKQVILIMGLHCFVCEVGTESERNV